MRNLRNFQNGRNLRFIRFLPCVWSAKNFGRFVLALAVAFACVVCFSSANAVKLKVGGMRTFYLYSASSQAAMRSHLTLSEIPFLKGESVAIKTDGVEAIEDRVLQAKKEVEKRGGIIVLEENAGGRYSLYCYLPEKLGLYDSVFVGGEHGGFVNLHIAFSEAQTVVGSPIIFGGY